MNEATIAIGLVILVIFLFGIKKTMSHFKGESDCCGGGSTPEVATVKAPKKQLSGEKLGEIKLKIDGMMCANCQAKVENRLNKLQGVAANADYKTGQVILEYSQDITDQAIKDSLAQSDYKLIEIIR